MSNPTEKLFYSEPYLKGFEATVVSCEVFESGFLIVLDRTAFYPEGGGQPADTGRLGKQNRSCGDEELQTLETPGFDNAVVKDVRERGGVIYHYVEDWFGTSNRTCGDEEQQALTSPGFTIGSRVNCEINWGNRFSRMQHHTGEHIVSGLVKEHFGLDNVGFHMGSEAVTIDFNGSLNESDLQRLELLANEVIYKNLPVEVSYPDSEQLRALPYRSKKQLDGDVRIVTVPGYDCCACCGTHTAYTGEIGIVKFITSQSYKGGIRISMLCGTEALKDYQNKNKSVFEISGMLSAKPGEISNATEKLLRETAELKQKNWALKTELFKLKAKNFCGFEKVVLFAEDLNPNELKQFCLLICELSNLVAIFSGDDKTGYKYVIGSQKSDAAVIGKEVNNSLNGKGGGAKGFVQGSVSFGKNEIEAFFTSREWQVFTV